MAERFYVELIKPSHYDDDGYVIQWWKAWIPSNSLASLYGLALDAASRRVLGDDVEIVVNGYDECNQRLPVKGIIKRLTEPGASGLVCLVGVQSNQFPRAVDLATVFMAAGVPVVIGGFHVSGCLSMLPSVPAEMEAAMEAGISLFAGEAEGGRLGALLEDAHGGRLKPLYNYLSDLPDIQGEPAPVMPASVLRRYSPAIGSFDAGRGCPFQCSFCTIINVQGRKSRYRSAEDVERLVRDNLARGISNFFITDDDFARNKNWEAIFEVLIRLREDVPELHFILQVDALAHRLPNFVAKASRAGCKRVFIGLESVSPENLLSVKKRQNHFDEYRTMLQAWRNAGVFIYAGYILGFPADTPASIARDIRLIQNELPVDLLEFFILTPLPGSEDHQRLHAAGAWMSPELNNYDLEHVVSRHPTMSTAEWQSVYRQAWDLYYSPEHIETLMRRAVAGGLKAGRLMLNILQFHGSLRFEGVHPLQSGFFRLKYRHSRRPDFPLESPLIFYPRRLWELASTYLPFLIFVLQVIRIRRRVERDPATASYSDAATRPCAPEAPPPREQEPEPLPLSRTG